jgi:hypothetical protein
MEIFYNDAVQPALIQVVPQELRITWPAKYRNEIYRADPRHGDGAEDRQAGRAQPQHTGRDVHAEHLNPWLDDIKARVAQQDVLSWARGFFLLVEAKGMKHRDGIPHVPPEEELADRGT